jgi:glutathione S-transferase
VRIAHHPALSRGAPWPRPTIPARAHRSSAGWSAFWGFYRTPEPQWNWPAIRDKLARYARHFELLDRMLAQQPYLAGNALTLADIPAGTALYRYFELDIERPSVPNVETWYLRLQDRPAYRAHVMVPFGELSGRLDP